MTTEKLKQYIGLFGGLLSATLLFLQTLGLYFNWFNQDSIDAFINVFLASVPFMIVLYGIWKNTYIVSKQARAQEKELQKKGLK